MQSKGLLGCELVFLPQPQEALFLTPLCLVDLQECPQAKAGQGSSAPPEATPTGAPESSSAACPPAPASGMSQPPAAGREDKSPSEESAPTTSPESVSG